MTGPVPCRALATLRRPGWLAGLLTLLLTAAAPARATEIVRITPELAAAATKEGTVTVQYSMPLASMEGVVAQFNKQYPSVEVVLVRNAGSAGGQKLLTDFRAGVQDIDVIEGSDLALDKDLVAAGAVLDLTPENARDVPPGYSIQPGMWTDVATTSVTAYNTERVTPAQAAILARGWDGILDPQFKGRFSMVTPTVGSTLTPLNYVLNAPGLGEPYLRKLAAQNPVIFPTTAQARDALVAGSTPIAWMHAWDAISMQLIGTGAPIRFLYTEPSVQYPGSFWGVATRTAHPAASRLFWAWILSAAPGAGCEASMMDFMNNQCVLAGVKDTRPQMAVLHATDWFRDTAKPFATVLPEQAVANNAANAALWYKVFNYQP